MMAQYSTPAEVPAAWEDLWTSSRWLHPEAEAALQHAIAAGVDPHDLRLVQLVGDNAPAFWFGPRGGECTIYSPSGIAGTGMVGRTS